MGAAPVATRYTEAFVRRHLPPGPRALLEVGCGNGELAACLAAGNLDVLALDSDATSISAAREAGVEARQATWPIDVGAKFDAVLFTRSLHHIAPLDSAIDAAVAALKPNGVIVVEDFRIELDSRRTTAWFTGLMRLLAESGAFKRPGTLGALLEKLDFGEHRHELHSSTAVAASLARHGTVIREDAAYCFRYAETELDEPLTAMLLSYELALIEAGAIEPLGARFAVRLA